MGLISLSREPHSPRHPGWPVLRRKRVITRTLQHLLFLQPPASRYRASQASVLLAWRGQHSGIIGRQAVPHRRRGSAANNRHGWPWFLNVDIEVGQGRQKSLFIGSRDTAAQESNGESVSDLPRPELGNAQALIFDGR